MDRTQRPERKNRRLGKTFENYVASLFNEQEWVLEDRSSDTAHEIGRSIEGDMAYDWIIRHRLSGRRFIIECKYRIRFHEQSGHEGIWVARPWQLSRYRDYQKEKGYDYFLIIGVGGTPNKPNYMYSIPLSEMRYEFVWRTRLNRFARDPQMAFTLTQDGQLR
jgi:hypothetical protein